MVAPAQYTVETMGGSSGLKLNALDTVSPEGSRRVFELVAQVTKGDAASIFAFAQDCAQLGRGIVQVFYPEFDDLVLGMNRDCNFSSTDKSLSKCKYTYYSECSCGCARQLYYWVPPAWLLSQPTGHDRILNVLCASDPQTQVVARVHLGQEGDEVQVLITKL